MPRLSASLIRRKRRNNDDEQDDAEPLHFLSRSQSCDPFYQAQSLGAEKSRGFWFTHSGRFSAKWDISTCRAFDPSCDIPCKHAMRGPNCSINQEVIKIMIRDRNITEV